MAGSVSGGKKAAQTNKRRYGENFYVTIGALGGKTSTGGGFGSDTVGSDGLTGLERAQIYGRKGGQASRRTAFSVSGVCKHGHATSPENSIYTKDGKLYCRACRVDYTRRHNEIVRARKAHV